MLSKMYNLIKYCYEDSITNQFAGIEFQLFLISSKSLVPYEDRLGCMFDRVRYRKELEVFKYYKSANDNLLDNYFENKKISSLEDNLLEYKILPIILSNTVYEISIEEALKNIFIFTNNQITVLDSIIISSAIYEYFNSAIPLDIDNYNVNTKNRLIEFSLKDLFNKYNIEANNNYFINFEKERIKLIEKNIFSDDRIFKFKALQFIFNESNTYQSKDIYKGYESVLNNFASYILKIRKGILNPEKLKYQKDIIPDLKEYLHNTDFNHPLLGKCTVFKRNDNEVVFKNKLGLYRVKI